MFSSATPKIAFGYIPMHDQASQCRRLFASVVMTVLDDAIVDCRKGLDGVRNTRLWANSRDGREVLMCAGITHSPAVVAKLCEFVERGVRTSVALSKGN